MGRKNILPVDRYSCKKLHLLRLRWVDGDYDEGRAYWGNPGGSWIYWATDGNFEMFVRASSRADGKTLVRKLLPSAQFYR